MILSLLILSFPGRVRSGSSDSSAGVVCDSPDAPPGDSVGPCADSSLAGEAILVRAAGLSLGEKLLREPLGLDIDSRGNIFVADAMAGKVFRFSRDGESLEFETPADLASLYPIDVAVQGTFVFVLDYSLNRILRYDLRGAYLDILLSFEEHERMHPASLSAVEGGRIMTTDVENHVVTVWTPLMDVELKVGEFGWSKGSLNRPRKAAVLPGGDIAVVESGNRRVQLFSPAGGYKKLLKTPKGEGFNSPRSISADKLGNIFVADAGGGRILVFSPEGDYLTDVDEFNGSDIEPSAVCVSWDDLLYVADLRSRTILVYRVSYPSRQ